MKSKIKIRGANIFEIAEDQENRDVDKRGRVKEAGISLGQKALCFEKGVSLKGTSRWTKNVMYFHMKYVQKTRWEYDMDNQA